MSHWHGDFKAAFFRAWVAEGLPDPERLSDEDREYWRSEPIPGDWRTYLRGSGNRALHPDVISTVFGFGCFIGRVCGDLFGLDERRVAARADWCGRFNLGISLFDYVCDELPEETRHAMLALPVFAPFTSDDGGRDGGDVGDVGRLLDLIATGVLRDLARETGAPTAHRRRYGLWQAFRNMYAAQLIAASQPIGPGADLQAVVRQLKLKSSEPFRVMAEWMARDPTSTVSTRKAAHVGRCIGDCFWLVDDAQDIWTDLDSSRWNYFLARSMELDPALRFDVPGPVLEARLAGLWNANDVSAQASRKAVKGLAKALAKLGSSPARQDRAAGRLGAAIARWAG